MFGIPGPIATLGGFDEGDWLSNPKRELSHVHTDIESLPELPAQACKVKDSPRAQPQISTWRYQVEKAFSHHCVVMFVV